MNMRVIYISLLMCLTTIAVFAQDSKTALPDLQTAEPDFFDPTRKVELKFFISPLLYICMVSD